MSKHSELAQLLTAFELAVRNHAAATQPVTLSNAAFLYEVADKAEKRVFSFFDAMQTALTDEVRRTESIREQRDAIARSRDLATAALKRVRDKRDALRKDLCEANNKLAELLRNGAGAPAMPARNVPFDEAAAVAGKPVQVLYDGVWRDVKYVGTGEYGHIVECGNWAQNPLSYWGVEKMRMKPQTTRQIQMFANVRSASSGAIFGALYESSRVAELNASAVNSSGAPLATATPVVITVAD